MKPGGVILYNRDAAPADFSVPHARVVCVPASDIADKLGAAKVANVIMLGALLKETECLPSETAVGVLEATVKKAALMDMNKQAIKLGAEFIEKQARSGAVSQPDGFAY